MLVRNPANACPLGSRSTANRNIEYSFPCALRTLLTRQRASGSRTRLSASLPHWLVWVAGVFETVGLPDCLVIPDAVKAADALLAVDDEVGNVP